MECTEHIKLLPRDEFLAIFDEQKFVVKETAKLSFDALHQTPINLAKCAASVPASQAAKSTKNVSVDPELPKSVGRKRVPIAGKNKGRKSAQAPGNGELYEGIIGLWTYKGHQTNMCRIAVCHALNAGYTKAGIAREVRTSVYQDHPWDGKGSGDAIFKRIRSVLLRIHNDMKAGLFDEMITSPTSANNALISKSVKLGARGGKVGRKFSSKKKKDQLQEEQDNSAVEMVGQVVDEYVGMENGPDLEEIGYANQEGV